MTAALQPWPQPARGAQALVVAGTALVRRVRLLQAIGRRGPVLGARPSLGRNAPVPAVLGRRPRLTAAVAVLPPGWQTPGRSCDRRTVLGHQGPRLAVRRACGRLARGRDFVACAPRIGRRGRRRGRRRRGRRSGCCCPRCGSRCCCWSPWRRSSRILPLALLAIDVVPSLPGCRASSARSCSGSPRSRRSARRRSRATGGGGGRHHAACGLGLRGRRRGGVR